MKNYSLDFKKTNIFERGSTGVAGGIVGAVFVLSCLIIILMPVEVRGKIWVYNMLILPILASGFLFKGIGGTGSSIASIITGVLLFKQYGVDPAQSFITAFLSSGMLAECVVYFVIGIAIDFSDIIFGSFSSENNPEEKKVEEDKTVELSKLKKDLIAVKAACDESTNKVNSISSKMVILQSIAREMGECLNIDDLLKSTLNATNKLFKARKISIFLKGEGNKLVLKGTYGWGTTNPADYVLISDREILMWSVMNNSMASPEELSKNPILSAIQRESRVKTLMCAPICHNKEVLGVINVEELEAGMRITLDEMRLFQILVDFVSLSFKNSRLFKKVEMLANTDGLTKLYTHRFFQDVLRAEIDRSGRQQENFSVILSDIDHFKKFNDTYGHQAGDFVLEQTAAAFKACVKSTDVVARYGGEEFITILPDTNVNGAYVQAERIRKFIESQTFTFGELQLKVTVTLGVATFPVDSTNNIELVKKADLALYCGKEKSRNCSMVASMISNLDEIMAKKDKK